ncbi:YciI family protein [Sinomonas sp. ASV322]|uniref:YciI family protein n=1 Tax=Sinomonas sp. ASV322 TaxID=3041920 RepID=UPI0027DD268C|nr:YciI family protein [Sinomonas sp. ASV322]MDQ4501074.1 YciI family protein [Sinomonas sp. ASV322]
MTQYLIAMYQPDGVVPPPEVLGPIMAKIEEFNADLRAADAWVFSNGLTDPSSATVLRRGEGEVLVTDGPYLEGKEHLGGFEIIEAPDLDAALSWGRRLAAITGLPIEVRAFASGG